MKQFQQEIYIKTEILELKHNDKTEKVNKELQRRLKHEERITNLIGQHYSVRGAKRQKE